MPVAPNFLDKKIPPSLRDFSFLFTEDLFLRKGRFLPLSAIRALEPGAQAKESPSRPVMPAASIAITKLVKSVLFFHLLLFDQLYPRFSKRASGDRRMTRFSRSPFPKPGFPRAVRQRGTRLASDNPIDERWSK